MCPSRKIGEGESSQAAMGMLWWGLCTDGVLAEGCAGKIQIVGLWRDVDGSRSRYRRFLGSTIQHSAAGRACAKARSEARRKRPQKRYISMSRALIHAYYVVRSSTTTIGAARTNEEQRRSARTGKEPSRPPPSSSTSPSAKSCRRSETLGQSNGHDSLLRRRGRRRPDTLRGSSSCS